MKEEQVTIIIIILFFGFILLYWGQYIQTQTIAKAINDVNITLIQK